MGEEGKVGEVKGKKEEKACHVCVCARLCDFCHHPQLRVVPSFCQRLIPS